MDKTFINIGDVVRQTEWARVKYHPLLSKRNLVIKSKTSSKKIDSIATFELHVDMDNDVISIKEADGIPDQLDIIRYALSSADAKVKYLVGSVVAKKLDIETQLSFNGFTKFYVEKYGEILNTHSFIYKYRTLLETELKKITDVTSKYIDDDSILEIAFITTITFNGISDVAHAFQPCLNEIDEMFISKSHVENRGYIFKNAFYSMFNYGKYETNGVKTMYDDSIPYYDKDDFLSLYYAKKIYQQTSYNIDRKSGYSISIFPNYDGLKMEEIENLLFKSKNIFDFNMVCKEIENLIASRTKRNMLRLTGVRYTQLLKIRKHIEDAYKMVYDRETIPEKFIIAILFSLYKDHNENPDRYMTTIFRTLQNIYQEKYGVPQRAEFCLFDKAQFIARKGDETLGAIYLIFINF